MTNILIRRVKRQSGIVGSCVDCIGEQLKRKKKEERKENLSFGVRENTNTSEPPKGYGHLPKSQAQTLLPNLSTHLFWKSPSLRLMRQVPLIQHVQSKSLILYPLTDSPHSWFHIFPAAHTPHHVHVILPHNSKSTFWESSRPTHPFFFILPLCLT